MKTKVISLLLLAGFTVSCAAAKTSVPPGWEVLPIPRYVSYGSPTSFITVGKAAIVRQVGGPYQSVRDRKGDLGKSTITEEELTGILNGAGIGVVSVSDDLGSYDAYDTLILLGNPQYNKLTDKYFNKMKLSFAKWDDPNTPGHDFNEWKDLGKEGYVLKVGEADGKNIIILAGYDFDDSKNSFWGAGTFYAMQSLRQMIVKEGDAVKIKTAEIADRPLIDVRGCYTGWPVSEEVNLKAIELLPPLKMNQNVFWYGSQVVTYNAQSASKFRYPWNEEQLAFCAKVGKYCQEHFITQVFGMNADHYNSMWATAKTLDGKERDPLHYDLKHEVEPGVKEMWAKIGYDVKNDIDVLAAKYTQLNKVCPTAAFSMFNEDDVFGLVHEDDKKLYGMTGDEKQDAIKYGKARGTVLAALYRRIREMCPDSPDIIPICPPGNVAYQTDIENNAYHCRDFMYSFTSTLKELGVLDKMPVMTTGGGTAAEITTNKNMDDYKSWCSGGPVLISDNNFPYQHIGAYGTDPNAPHSYLQQNEKYPAGFREKDLYKRVWGVWANGITQENGDIVGWGTAQFMWNILALDKNHIDAAATRKVTSAETYPIVKSFCEEFDDGACYLSDELRPNPPFAVSDNIRFAGKGWAYVIDYTDNMRIEAQRLRTKLGNLIPQLVAKWDIPSPAAQNGTGMGAPGGRLRWLGYDSYTFCSVYLARGYIKGWQNDTPKDKLSGSKLRDIYLEADDIQERFFAGPLKPAGMIPVERQDEAFAFGRLVKLITGERIKSPIAESPAECKTPFVDIWQEGLQGKFFELVSYVAASDFAENNGWGKVEEADGVKFRTAQGEASVDTGAPAKGIVLVRMRIGTATTALTDPNPTKITLSAGKASRSDAVCKPRWITWMLPKGASAQKITIKADKPVRVYVIDLYKEKAQQ